MSSMGTRSVFPGVLIALGWLGLVGVQGVVGFGFVLPGVLLMLMARLLMGLLISIVGVMGRWRRGAWRTVWWFAGSLTAVFLSIGAATAIKSMEQQRAMRAAGPLILAMGKYREVYGQYPDRLEALIPQLLEAGPSAAFFGTAPYRLG